MSILSFGGEQRMAIKKDTTGKLFTLLTNNSMYQMKVDDLGFLVHTWFGKGHRYLTTHT